MRSMHIEELSNNTIVSRVSISKAMQSKDQSEVSIDISHPRNLLHEIKEKSLTVVPTSKENSLAVTKKKKKSVPRAEEKRESKTHSIERGSKAHSMERGIKTHPVEKNGTTYIINLNKALHFHRKKTIVTKALFMLRLSPFKEKLWVFTMETVHHETQSSKIRQFQGNQSRYSWI